MPRLSTVILAVCLAIIVAPVTLAGECEHGDGANPIDDCTRAIASDPDEPSHYYNRAWRYSLAEKFGEAITDLSKAIALAPTWQRPLYLRADALQRQGKHTDALADLSRLIEINPRYGWWHIFRAIAHRYAGNLHTAVDDLSVVIDDICATKQCLHPTLPRALKERADVFYHLRKYQRAIDDYSRVIALDPNHVYPLYWRAQAYQILGQHGLAIIDLNKVIALAPNNREAYLRRAFSYSSKNMPDPAIIDYTTAIDLDPTDPDVFEWRSELYDQMAEVDLALADLDSAIKLKPNDVRLLQQRAYLNSKKTATEYSIPDLSAAIDLDPNDAHAVLQRAAAFIELKAIKSALTDLDRLIMDHCLKGRCPQFFISLVYRLRAMIHKQLGDHARAIEDFRHAHKLDPDSANNLFDLGMMEFDLGDWAGSAATFRAGLHMNPDYGALMLHIAEARAGITPTIDLKSHMETLPQSAWPSPILELYAGLRSPEFLIAEARGVGQVCEAQYFVGLYHLLARETAKARTHLQFAANRCPRNFYEHALVDTELTRLAK